MSELYFRKTYKNFFDFVLNTQDELIILCPYIKLEPLKLLLENIESSVKIIVVARWRLSDLVFGSSDIEIFDYLKSLNHNFYINNKIHLKVIVKDKKDVLIGSANITGSGLGLFENSNIEAISIDILDKKYLPEIYSILHESILVDSDLVKKIKKDLVKFKDIKKDNKKIEDDLEEIEKKLFIAPKNNVVVSDFIFTASPEIFLQSVQSKNLNEIIIHDLNVLKLNANKCTLEILKEAFLSSDAYLWQLENIKGSVLFGKYSEILHNKLIDNPRPYRKDVKELVANMFAWTKEFSDDFEIIKHNHTSSMKRK